ncbi:MAG: acetolactate decarboxylase [Dehalococcoidales bacterium]|nr:acetolactate decarboxylase [Dehalococcoidales bacterium]
MSIVNNLRKLSQVILICVLISALAGCSSDAGNPVIERETLTQVSTIGALMEGLYDGVITVGELKEYGDFGIGTFEGLDGEMVVLDGKCYQVKDGGIAYLVDDSLGVPFADVTYFDNDYSEKIAEGFTYEQVKTRLNEVFPTQNIFYAIKIEGTFTYMQTRSVPAQEKPYPSLTAVTANQVVFDFTEVTGSIVGFYCPKYVDGVGVAGFHLHFLTDSLDAGGHILNFTVKDATVNIDYTSEFYLILPGKGSDFYDTDFSDQYSDEIEEAES